MLAKFRGEVLPQIKNGITSALMEDVVLPMQKGGVERLLALDRQRKKEGGRLPKPLATEYKGLVWNARILKFFAGTEKGRRITEWLAK